MTAEMGRWVRSLTPDDHSIPYPEDPGEKRSLFRSVRPLISVESPSQACRGVETVGTNGSRTNFLANLFSYREFMMEMAPRNRFKTGRLSILLWEADKFQVYLRSFPR